MTASRIPLTMPGLLLAAMGCAAPTQPDHIPLSLSASAAPVGLETPAGTPGTCPHDVKLLNGGPTMVFGEGPGTWWGLVTTGLSAAGLVQEDDQLAYLNRVFGTDFDNLADLEAFNLQLVEDGWDKNGNGYVCAYELRGTRAHYDDPFLNLTFFGISDDRVPKK